MALEVHFGGMGGPGTDFPDCIPCRKYGFRVGIRSGLSIDMCKTLRLPAPPSSVHHTALNMTQPHQHRFLCANPGASRIKRHKLCTHRERGFGCDYLVVLSGHEARLSSCAFGPRSQEQRIEARRTQRRSSASGRIKTETYHVWFVKQTPCGL